MTQNLKVMTKYSERSLHNSAWVQHLRFSLQMLQPSANDINLSLTHNVSVSSMNLASKRRWDLSKLKLVHYWSLLMCLTVRGKHFTYQRGPNWSCKHKASDTCSRFCVFIDSFHSEIHQSLCHFVLNFRNDKSLHAIKFMTRDCTSWMLIFHLFLVSGWGNCC